MTYFTKWKRNIKKCTRRSSVLSLVLICPFVYGLINISFYSNFKGINQFDKVQWNLKIDQTCAKKNHLMFLKTHKCASSTLQNIIMKYGMRNNLTFALPAEKHYLGGYLKFEKKFISDTLIPKSGLVDIFCLHTRLNAPALKSVLHNDTVWITILREPFAHFQSFFNYFGFDEIFNFTLENIPPYPNEKVLKIAEKHILLNMMAFNLGMDPSIEMTKFYRKISEIDELFDLVLIVEKLEESLILLRDKMCWSTEDILFVHQNVQIKRPTNLASNVIETIRQYNERNVILYEYFLRKHEEMVLKFGKMKMREEVKSFRKSLALFYQKCVAEKEVSDNKKPINIKEDYGPTIWYLPSENSSVECKMSLYPEPKFVDIIRQNQFKKLNRQI